MLLYLGIGKGTVRADSPVIDQGTSCNNFFAPGDWDRGILEPSILANMTYPKLVYLTGTA